MIAVKPTDNINQKNRNYFFNLFTLDKIDYIIMVEDYLNYFDEVNVMKAEKLQRWLARNDIK